MFNPLPIVGWNRVIGQERVVDVLRRAVDRDRVAHAYLFHGPEGSGKRAAAIALAQALLCERPADRPCGSCPSCARTLRLVHPDLQVLMPFPRDAKPEAIRERVERLSGEPYATIDFARRSSLDDPGEASGKQVQYSVSFIREELHPAMSLRAVEGKYKIAVLTDAEALRKEAANAFLKLLEEPTPNTVFVLTATRIDRLLPTIVSRCQQVRFDRLRDGDVADALVRMRKLEPGFAATVARMADGSYGRALDLAGSEELMASRETVVQFLRSSFRAWSDAESMARRTEELARRGREHQKFLLGLMLLWIRDVMLYRQLGGAAPIVNVDQAEVIARFSDSLPEADPAVLVDLVEEAIGLVDRNVNPNLVLPALAMQLNAAMKGGGERRLYVPLSEPAAT